MATRRRRVSMVKPTGAKAVAGTLARTLGGHTGPASAAPARMAPTSPPPGSYDPAIDAQVGQTQRGLADLLSDYIRDFGEPGTALGGRRGEDFTLGREGIERQAGRSLADLLQARSRGGEDYKQQVTGLQRSFAQLGAAQGQAARAAGVQRGGALAQAMAKRQANEQIARQPIDTGFQRFNADSTLSEQRLGEDKGLALGGLQRDYLRGVDDAGISLARAGRENTQFGLDASQQRFYQANMPLDGGPAPVPASVRRAPAPSSRQARVPTMGRKKFVYARGFGGK